MSFTFVVIDSILFVRESTVAKTRERFMKSTIELLSQSAFMEEIKRQKKYSFNATPFTSKSLKV